MSQTAAATEHPPSEPGVEADDLNTATIVVVGLVSTALVLASALGVKALYQAYIEIDSANKALQTRHSAANDAVNNQMSSLLGAPRAMPGQAGVYSLPIDQAMKLVVEELSAEQKPSETPQE